MPCRSVVVCYRRQAGSGIKLKSIRAKPAAVILRKAFCDIATTADRRQLGRFGGGVGMRVGLGGVLVACVCVTAPAAVAAQSGSDIPNNTLPITTAPAVEPPAPDVIPAQPVLIGGPPPWPRMRPAHAPKPPETNSPEDVCNTIADSARTHRLPIAFFGNLI